MARLFYGDGIFVDLFDQNQRSETQKKQKHRKQKKLPGRIPPKGANFDQNHRGKTQKNTKTINKKKPASKQKHPVFLKHYRSAKMQFII